MLLTVFLRESERGLEYPFDEKWKMEASSQAGRCETSQDSGN